MAVKYREDESINFNPNLAAGQLQVGSAGAGGEALSQGLETFKPQTAEAATILPQTTFQPISGVGQATSNIFESIQKRFGSATPQGDFERDIFRNIVEPEDEKDIEKITDEQELIDEFGLIQANIDPTITSPTGPDLKPGQVGYKTLKKLDDGLTNLFDILGNQARTTSTGGGGRGAKNVFEENKTIITDAINNIIGTTQFDRTPSPTPVGTTQFDTAPAPTPGISPSVSPGVTEDISSIGRPDDVDPGEQFGGFTSGGTEAQGGDDDQGLLDSFFGNFKDGGKIPSFMNMKK